MPPLSRHLGLGLLMSIALLSVTAQNRPSESNALFPIEQNSRWGYIDSLGKIVIEPRFEAAGEFSHGLAPVEIDAKWGFINETGELVVKAQYSGAHEFSEGLARVQVGGDKYGMYGKWGFIDETGRMVIEPRYGELNGVGDGDSDFHEGLAMFEIDRKKGFIDKAGSVVIAPRFEYAYHFSEGLASVCEGLDKWGYIDQTGQWAILPKLDWGSLFSEGLAPVTLNGVCGYVDRTGDLKLKPKFKEGEDCATVWGSFDGGLSRWKVGDKYGYIDRSGQFVIKPEFDLTFNFSEGMAFVVKDGKYGFINQAGVMAIEPQFYDAKDFHNGLARVSYSARESWGYVNKAGEFVWKTASAVPKTDAANSFVQAGHTRDLLFVGWSPDGHLLASYSAADGWIKVWNPSNGRLLWDIQATALKPGERLRSPDGNLLVSGTRDVSYEIRDARSSNLIWQIKAHGTSEERVLSPDGRIVAARGRYGDACVSLVDAKTNQLIRRLEGHPGIVYAIAFSPDGNFIASGSGDKSIKLWDAQTGKLLNTLAGHSLQVTAVAFSADAKTLASGSQDDTLQIWNVSNGQLIRTIPAFSGGVGGIDSVAISPDGKNVIAGSGTQIKVFDTATGKQVRTLETRESHTSGGPGGLQTTSCCGSEVRAAIFSSDGDLIASAHEDGTLKLWDLKSSKPIRTIQGRFPDLGALAFSPDGNFIASGYDEEESRISLWSVQDGRLVKQFGEESDYVHSLAFSPDGRMVVSGHMSDDVKLWEAKTGKLLRQFKQPFSMDDEVAFSPDSKRIVSGGENQNILLWDATTGRLIWSLIPIDWEAEKRAEKEAAEQARIDAFAKAERDRQAHEADKAAAGWESQITITFEHFGPPINPLEQRLLEKGDPTKSLIQQPAAEATGVWLRLRNNSPLPISFRTDSFYLPRPTCGVRLSNGKNGPGLCDGREVSIQYQIEDASGKPVPWGIDVSSMSILPPGASVLFSAPLAHLQNSRVISIAYNFEKENDKHELEAYGTAHRVVLKSFKLP
ncbi:MAG: WG repeat-containing protein [Pyrinomonadaceae bacterium]|nr:WG repeat-containing protein [Pyrinomonadaceae bacterium]